MLSPKPKSILDTMANQTRSKVTIPADPVIQLPGKSKKTKSKPAIKPASVSVIVETLPTKDTIESTSVSTDAITLVDSGETVPASLEVAQVDVTTASPTVPSASAPRTSTPSPDDNDNKDAPVDMKPSPFDRNKDSDDAAADDDAADDDDPDDDAPISVKQTSLNCSFLFESSITSPGMADELNGSYDLSFRSDELFHHPGVLTPCPT